MGHKMATSKKQSLDVLESDFKRMRANIRQLIEALRAQHLTLLRMNETRLKVALRIAALAEGSAIGEEAGDVPPTAVQNGATVDDTDPDLSSYMAVHSRVSSRQKANADRFLKHIVEYAIEWEKVIVARVTTSLKTSENLRRDLDHYASKVESLKLECNKAIARGRMVDGKVTTRLQRNEEKRSQAKTEYDVFAAGLMVLLEEVCVRGWKDLHPILLKLAQFDRTTSGEESGVFGHLTGVVERLQRIGSECGLQPNARLRELGELADMGVAGGRPQALNSSLMESPSSQAIVQSHSQGSYDQNESFHGHQQHQQQQQYNNNERDLDAMPMTLSTTQMISVAEHSAPPPTMDMVEDSFRQTSIDDESLSAPSAPPPPPPPQQQQQQQQPTSSYFSTCVGIRC